MSTEGGDDNKMAETKYGDYVIREPLHQSMTGIPTLHACAEEGCVASKIPDFPNEITMMVITAPVNMNPNPHAHDYDQILAFLGSNPLNLFEFDAEIEVSLGEEGEKQLIDTTSLVFIPKGLIHCPINFKRIGKPVIFMHICDAPQYTRSAGDLSSHPSHSIRVKYPLEEILKLRKGIIPGT
jgi:hypothetical protein